MGLRTPHAEANWRICWSGSMAKMKSISESGSPCRTPQACLKAWPGFPLRRTRDEDVLPLLAWFFKERNRSIVYCLQLRQALRMSASECVGSCCMPLGVGTLDAKRWHHAGMIYNSRIIGYPCLLPIHPGASPRDNIGISS